MRLRGSVTKAIQFRKSEENLMSTKIQNLKNDLLNAPYHVFGEHKNCSKYFCKGMKETEVNVVDDLKKSRLFYQIVSISTYLAKFADSLIHNMNNNLVEHFNYLIAKKIS